MVRSGGEYAGDGLGEVEVERGSVTGEEGLVELMVGARGLCGRAHLNWLFKYYILKC